MAPPSVYSNGYPGSGEVYHCEGARVGIRCTNVPTFDTAMPKKLLPAAKLLIIGPVAAIYKRSMPEYQGSSEPLVVSCASFLIVVTTL